MPSVRMHPFEFFDAP